MTASLWRDFGSLVGNFSSVSFQVKMEMIGGRWAKIVSGYGHNAFFSYGSNTSTFRLTDRLPSARAEAITRLHKHRLNFPKKSKDSSGKRDAGCTNDEKDFVFGVVLRITLPEKPESDTKGLKTGNEINKIRTFQ